LLYLGAFQHVRCSRRWKEAIEAYEAALADAKRTGLPPEKTAAIAGELGACELALGRHRDAAEHLQRALDYPKSLNPDQQQRFIAAQNKAESHVGTIIIGVNPSDAEILVDGKSIGAGEVTYIVFVEPGTHAVRARLSGYGDAEQMTDADCGETTNVAMRLSTPTVVPALTLMSPESKADQASTDRSPANTPAPRDAPERRYSFDDTYAAASMVPLLALGLGPALSPGVSLDVTWRLGRFTINGESRLFSSQTTRDKVAIRTFSGRFQASACGHSGFLSLCGLASIGGIEALKDPTIKEIETQEPWCATIGLRPGAEWRFTEHLALRGFVEVHAVMGQPSVWVNNEKAWEAPPVAGLLGLGIMLPFDRQETNGTQSALRGGTRVY
jgi:hypothetical protein